MNSFARWLVASFALNCSFSMAQDTLPRDDAAMEINFAYSQQEYGTIAVDLLAPRMGDWGRLGINLGVSSYVSKDRLMRVNQHALAWHLDEPFLRIAMASSPGVHTLGLASTLRVGTQSYENWFDAKVQRDDHSFFEMDAVFQIRSQLDPGSGKWIRRSTFGLGTGFRANSIHKATFVGSKEVDRLHVYPTLQFSALFF